MVRNICFHIEYSLNDLSQGKPLSCSLDFQLQALTNYKVIGDVSSLIINTESDRVVYCFGKLLCISNG